MFKCRESAKMAILFILMIGAVFFYSKKIDSTLRTDKNVPLEIRKLLKKPAARKNPPSKILLIAMSSMTVIFTLRRITTSYELTPSNLIMRHGILQRRTDPVEMVKITDFTPITNPIMGIFGLSTVIVRCPKDDSHKKIKMRFLSNEAAKKVEEHLLRHATSTIAELLKAKESEEVLRKMRAESGEGDKGDSKSDKEGRPAPMMMEDAFLSGTEGEDS